MLGGVVGVRMEEIENNAKVLPYSSYCSRAAVEKPSEQVD